MNKGPKEPRLKTQLACVVNGDQKAVAMWGYEAHSVETLVDELRDGFKQILDLANDTPGTNLPAVENLKGIKEIALKHCKHE